MPEHSLEAGRQAIATLVRLGEALGYQVRTELPVEQRPRPPAVDVAWFADEEEQTYPLMIFEVETSASNTMANNPTKVFGQPSEKFERPLFFFHIIIRSGTETSRVENLKGVFGVHNYRIYRLDGGMGTQLVKDILTQHRRIRRRIDVGELMSVLLGSVSLPMNETAVLDHAVGLGLRGAYLSDLGELARVYVDAKGQFLRLLRNCQERRIWKDIDTGYRTWLGTNWSSPIHLGLLFAEFSEDRSRIFDQLQWWQERSTYMSQVGPHFGLSRDYDLFILGWAGGLWAVVACLVIEECDAVRYVAEQIAVVVRKLVRTERTAWMHSVVWGLHVSATGGDEVLFEEFRQFANDRGGIPRQILDYPPMFVSIEDEEWFQAVSRQSEPIPGFEEFMDERARIARTESDVDAVDVGLETLVTEEPLLQNGHLLVCLLSQNKGVERA